MKSNVSLGELVCAGLDVSTQAGVDDALLRGQQDDNTLYSVLRFLRLQSPATRRMADSTFAVVADFFTDSPCSDLARFAKRLQLRESGHIARHQMLSEKNGDLIGMELSNESGSQYVVFLPDASEPGRVRYSCFDEHGFFAHSTFDTYQQALEGAWMAGFRHRVHNKLNTLCLSQNWHLGSKLTAAIQQVNLGKLSYEQYLKEISA